MPVVRLPQNVINQIAAGEVVERPASVIKELVENALDSGADQIDIQVRNAGKTMICVRDNGVGMDKEDLALSVERHTTSKLANLDLSDISTFGFRGEALATISSVSRMSIKSWQENCENGWQLDIAGGESFSLNPITHGAKGTYIEVSDLFFATPARLKFLKSNATELAQCADISKRLALANHNIGFKLVSENFVSFDFARTDRIEQRVQDVLGKQDINDMCSVDFASSACKISGFCSIPTANSATAAHQYIFVNGRTIKDKFLTSAISVAYRELIPMGRYARLALFIEIDPDDLDVNVHPAKTEVRFRRSNDVRDTVVRALKSAISPYSSQTSPSLGHEFIDRIVKKTVSNVSHINDRRSADFKYNTPSPRSFALNDVSIDEATVCSGNVALKTKAAAQEAHNEGLFSDALSAPLGSVLGQLFGRYILAQTEDALVIVDQHAVHERLLYERFKDKRHLNVQQLLTPEVIETESELVALVEENKSELAALGLGIEKLDENHLAVRYMPADTVSDVKVLVNDILVIIKDEKNESFDQVLQEKILRKLATLACHSSIKGGQYLSAERMNIILRSIGSNRNMGQCNHGRPSFVKIFSQDIERLFLRQ
ncbi:MAG: DNA mismatch repair endonuclease MutL [Holosporales bacterium]|jgi:DNA mismatch repair protein MutL|nr:DNA mismatch repair endonuclease MutL [Holosporales bacterium]